MKVVCGGCQAKYQVSDERVAGKKLKIKCRRCAHTIIVRGDTLIGGAQEPAGQRSAPPPQRGTASAASQPPQPESVLEWFASVDGSEHGPMDRGALIAWLEAHPGAWEAYVWREGFTAWKVAREVPELVAVAAREQRGQGSASPNAENADWDDDAEPTRMLKLHMPHMHAKQSATQDEGLAAAGVGHRASVSAFGAAASPAEDYGRMRAAGGVSYRHSSPGGYGAVPSTGTMSGGYSGAVVQEEGGHRALHHSGFRQTGERRYTPAPTEDFSIDEGADELAHEGEASGGYVDRSFAGEPAYHGGSAFGGSAGYGAQGGYTTHGGGQAGYGQGHDARGHEAPSGYEGSNYPDLYRDPAYSSGGHEDLGRVTGHGEPSLFDRGSQPGNGSAPPLTGELSQPPELIDIHSLGNGGLASAQLPLHSMRDSSVFEGGFPASIADVAEAHKARKVMPYAIMGAAATLAAAVVGVFFLLDSDDSTTDASAATAQMQTPTAVVEPERSGSGASGAGEAQQPQAAAELQGPGNGEYDEPAAPPAARRRRGMGVGMVQAPDPEREAENRARLDALNRGEVSTANRDGSRRPATRSGADLLPSPAAQPQPQQEPPPVAAKPPTVDLPKEATGGERREALSDDPMAGLESEPGRDSNSGDSLEALLDGVKAPSASGSSAPSAAPAVDDESGRSIDDLLSGAVNQPGAPAPAAAAPVDIPEQPDRDDVLRALKSVTPRVQRCATGAGISGTAKVTLTVEGTTGRVASALVSGVEGPASDCIKREVQSAKFPQFKKPKFNITFPFRLQ